MALPQYRRVVLHYPWHEPFAMYGNLLSHYYFQLTDCNGFYSGNKARGKHQRIILGTVASPRVFQELILRSTPTTKARNKSRLGRGDICLCPVHVHWVYWCVTALCPTLGLLQTNQTSFTLFRFSLCPTLP